MSFKQSLITEDEAKKFSEDHPFDRILFNSKFRIRSRSSGNALARSILGLMRGMPQDIRISFLSVEPVGLWLREIEVEAVQRYKDDSSVLYMQRFATRLKEWSDEHRWWHGYG